MLGWRRVRERRGCLPRGGCCYLDVVPPYSVQGNARQGRTEEQAPWSEIYLRVRLVKGRKNTIAGLWRSEKDAGMVEILVEMAL